MPNISKTVPRFKKRYLCSLVTLGVHSEARCERYALQIIGEKPT